MNDISQDNRSESVPLLGRFTDYFNPSMWEPCESQIKIFCEKLSQAAKENRSLGFDGEFLATNCNNQSLPLDLRVDVLVQLTSQIYRLNPAESSLGRYAKVISAILESVEARQSDDFAASLSRAEISYHKLSLTLFEASNIAKDQCATVDCDLQAKDWFEALRTLRKALVQLSNLCYSDALAEQQLFEQQQEAERQDREAHITGSASVVEKEIRRICTSLLPDDAALEFRETETSDTSGRYEHTTYKGTLTITLVNGGVRSTFLEWPATGSNSQSMYGGRAADPPAFHYKIPRTEILSKFENTGEAEA